MDGLWSTSRFPDSTEEMEVQTVHGGSTLVRAITSDSKTPFTTPLGWAPGELDDLQLSVLACQDGSYHRQGKYAVVLKARTVRKTRAIVEEA